MKAYVSPGLRAVLDGQLGEDIKRKHSDYLLQIFYAMGGAPVGFVTPEVPEEVSNAMSDYDDGLRGKIPWGESVEEYFKMRGENFVKGYLSRRHVSPLESFFRRPIARRVSAQF